MNERWGFPRLGSSLDLLLSTVVFVTAWSRVQNTELACLASFVEASIDQVSDKSPVYWDKTLSRNRLMWGALPADGQLVKEEKKGARHKKYR